MKKNWKTRFGIGLILNICIALAFTAGAAFLIQYIHENGKKQALLEAEKKADIILKRNLAIHTYFTHNLKPAVFTLSDSIRSESYFEPSWMSSTYAVRSIDTYSKALGEDKYYYKECAINARSPENEADAFERAFIEELNADPGLTSRSLIRKIDDYYYFVILHRGEVMEESCLRCHSVPEIAPQALVDTYGAKRSFQRNIGEVISAISIRVPLSEAYANAGYFTKRLSIVFLFVLFSLFIFQYFFFKLVIGNPLSRIYDKVTRITGQDSHLGEKLPLPVGRELHGLSEAFNTMSSRLRNHLDHLEKKVKERTNEIVLVNVNLQKEIAQRCRLEENLKEAQRIAHVGSWYLDVASNQVVWSDELYKMYGFDPALPPPPYTEHQKLFTPESWGRLSVALPNTRETGTPYELELETVQGDGRNGWMWVRGEVVCDASGVTVGLQGVTQDITKRKQAEEDLLRTMKKLEEVNAELAQFNYVVAHDLKAPIRAMSNYTVFLQEDLASVVSGEQKTYLTRLSQTAIETGRMIEDLLHLAKIGSQKQQAEKIELGDFMAKLVSSMDLSPDIEISMDSEWPTIMSDPLLVRQIFQNLLDNAWKYNIVSPKRIVIGCLPETDESITCYVRDNGIGIAAEYHEQIFGLFERLHSPKEYSGTGVGLAIVKKAVNTLGGTIRVESTVGKGSTFYVALPVDTTG